MADINKRGPSDCDEGKRGKRGHRGRRGPAVETGPTYGLGPTIPGILQPEFVSPTEEVTIYARSTGSDATGDGTTQATAYRTFQRALRDVPGLIPGGYVYTVDITGIGTEVLPPDY